MFFNRTNVIIHVIFCILSIVPGSVIAMQHKEFSSDIHFYGKQRESRTRTPKITINSLPITESTSFVIENSDESIASINTPLITIPTIEITDTSVDLSDEAPHASLFVNNPEQDRCSKMYRKLSQILTKLQEEAMSKKDRHESFSMFKSEAHEWLKTSIKESPLNTVHFADLGAKAYLLMEKVEQNHECRALQAQCLVAQPDLDELD